MSASLTTSLPISSQTIGFAEIPSPELDSITMLIAESMAVRLVKVSGNGAWDTLASQEVEGLGWELTTERAVMRIPTLGLADKSTVAFVPGPRGITSIVVHTFKEDGLRVLEPHCGVQRSEEWWRIDQYPSSLSIPFNRHTPKESRLVAVEDVCLLDMWDLYIDGIHWPMNLVHMSSELGNTIRVDTAWLRLNGERLETGHTQSYRTSGESGELLIDLDRDGTHELLRVHRSSINRPETRIEIRASEDGAREWTSISAAATVKGIPLLHPSGTPVVVAVGPAHRTVVPTITMGEGATTIRGRLHRLLSDSFTVNIDIWDVSPKNDGSYNPARVSVCRTESSKDIALSQVHFSAEGDFTGDGVPDLLIGAMPHAYLVYPYQEGKRQCFQDEHSIQIARRTMEPPYVGDFNGDGKDDLLQTVRSVSSLTLLFDLSP